MNSIETNWQNYCFISKFYTTNENGRENGRKVHSNCKLWPIDLCVAKVFNTKFLIQIKPIESRVSFISTKHFFDLLNKWSRLPFLTHTYTFQTHTDIHLKWINSNKHVGLFWGFSKAAQNDCLSPFQIQWIRKYWSIWNAIILFYELNFHPYVLRYFHILNVEFQCISLCVFYDLGVCIRQTCFALIPATKFNGFNFFHSMQVMRLNEIFLNVGFPLKYFQAICPQLL